MNINTKSVLKNLFFGFAIWALGFILMSFFGAAWAAAVKWPPMLNVFMVIYLLASTLFFGWVMLDLFKKHTRPQNGKHHNGVPHD